MSGLPDLVEVRSTSKFGLSAVTVVFEDGTDIYFARQQISERLAAAKENIPPGYGEPEGGRQAGRGGGRTESGSRGLCQDGHALF